MNKGALYPRLAFQNIRNNRKFYIPYILTGMGVSMMLYIMLFLMNNEGLSGSFGGRTLIYFLTLGSVIIGIFSVVILFYTNSFLMKRRKNELGLFIILGMEKRHLGGVQFFESLYVGLVSIAGGLGLGIAFSKLTLSLLTKLAHFNSPLVFSVDLKTLLTTLGIFAAIYFLIFLYNLTVVGRAKPIELLKGGQVGEKEPKSKWVLTVIGILALAGGYGIAVLVKSPLAAIFLFFIAVILVILGTYLLFTTGSITVLKALKNNKRYYYKTSHFIGISGMIYRMKANAVGLANICILSTMVLVMVSSTVTLNMGVEDLLNTRYPADIVVNYSSPSSNVLPASLETIESLAGERGIELSKLDYSLNISLAVPYSDGVFDNSASTTSYDAASVVTVVSASEYARTTGGGSPAEGEALASYGGLSLPEEFDLLGLRLRRSGAAEDFPVENEMEEYMNGYVRLVLSDADYEKLISIFKAANEGYSGELLLLYIDADLPNAEMQEFSQDVMEALSENVSGENGESGSYEYSSMYTQCRADDEEDSYSAFGGLLFLGLSLGILFMMATILIIYYKQITEGYNDRERFIIMQKVGLSRSEIKKSIRGQILTVFFLPLIVAVLHLCFAFSIISKLLAMFQMTNVSLFVLCTAGTIGVFAVFYFIVYALTAREYYKIIS